jgi:4-hydroxyphenylpyruvate dioxygenase
VSPCGKIRIPINESADDRSQIVEYLNAYRGEGIQHVALRTNDIEASIDAIARRGIRFLTTPATYYEAIDARLPGHGLELARLEKRGILVDGTTAPAPRILLQIFTENVIGPIFFEVIERRGDLGFGEGNFKALFVAMEEDQVRRGVL